jgi:hypothetical protein
MAPVPDETRIFFPKLLTELGLLEEGVEVGVFEGWHAKLILDKWKGRKLYAVDPWKCVPYMRGNVCVDRLANNWKRQDRMDEAKAVADKRLAPYVKAGRCVILHKPTIKAYLEFEDESLDWAYIDGRHYREGVQEDMDCWYPKVKVGGVVAGHDYHNNPKNHFDVKKTVMDFYREREDKLVEVKTRRIPSWYAIKC